jgi:hypothetical protein
MRFRKREPLLSILLDTGLQLLDSVRERLPEDMDDMKDRVRAGYGTASGRVSRAANALRGEEESHIMGTVGTLLIGVGIGVGIGILIAPASGDETRRDLNDKVSDFGDKIRERTAKKTQGATGTDE